MHDLTAFERDCLIVTAGLPGPKGLDIKAELDAYYGTETNHGRLYPALDRLVSKGFMKKAEVDGRTNRYDVTDRGRRELAARREWEREYFGRVDS